MVAAWGPEIQPPEWDPELCLEAGLPSPFPAPPPSPPPPPLPAHQQTPVVEDRQGNDSQPAVVHVAGRIHHHAVLLVSGNTDTQTMQCAERSRHWTVFEIWGHCRLNSRDTSCQAQGVTWGVPAWEDRMGEGRLWRSFPPRSAPQEATVDNKITVGTFPCARGITHVLQHLGKKCSVVMLEPSGLAL